MQNRGIVLPVILLLVFLVSLLSVNIFYPKFKNNNPIELVNTSNIIPSITASKEPQTTVIKDNRPTLNYNIQIPLFSEVKWEKTEKVSREDNLYSIFVTDVSDNSVFEEQFYLAGETISAQINSREIKAEFEKYYDDELTDKGWKKDPIVVDNIRLTPFVADGPTGGSIGYMLYDKGIIQQVVLSEYSYESNPANLEIFISEKVDLNTVVEGVKR